MPNAVQSTDSGSEHRYSGHISALDGIRGVAIIIVLVHSSSFVLERSEAFLPKLAIAIAATGWIGVQLFFVLSGFLITGILLDCRGTQRFFRTFYIRRTLRIFPLYYAFLGLTFLVAPLVADPSWIAVARTNQWWYWTYLSNWGNPLGHEVPGLSHFWSLAVEEQFYLLWPLVIFFLSRSRLIALCVGIILVAPLARLVLLAEGLPAMAAYQFTIARWDALAFGAILAGLVRQQSAPGLARQMQLVGGAAAVSLALLVAVEHGFHEDDPSVQVLGQTFVAAISTWLIFISVAPATDSLKRIRSGISADWLRFFGKYSYAIYVFHFPIHRIASSYVAAAVNGPDTNWRLLRLAGYVGVVGALSTLAAVISWRVIEKPFLDLKDRLAPRDVALSRGAEEKVARIDRW